MITEKPPTLALVYLLDQEGYPLLRAGTDGGVRAWKAWAGEPVTASWGFDGAPHYLDKTHLSSRPLVGGRRIIEGTPDPPDESAITIDESRRVRIVGDDTSGPVTAEAVVVHESAVQSAPFVIYAALPMRLTGTESGKISHVTAVIEGTAPDARGRLYLLRPIRKNVWRRVRYLPIDSAGQAYFSLPLDNKLYALDYIPKNRRDLIPTHYTFHMKLIFGLRRGRVHAVLDRIERRFGASVVG